MSAQLNPYISFLDTARGALEFYRDVLGGDLAISTFREYGSDGPDADRIMHGRLETPTGFVLMAADTPDGMEHQTGSAITISLSGDDGDALRGWWDGLASGGTITMPLEKQMWGDEFGMLVDRFGVAWMVNISQPAT